MTRFRRTSPLLVLLGFTLFANAIYAQEDKEARRLEEFSTNAQNAGDYQAAADSWEKLIANHPEFAEIGKAHFNCGKCQLELGNTEKAISQFESAREKLPKEATVALPESYLYLGFCQSKLGKETWDADEKQAKMLLTTSTQTFASGIKSFPDFQHLDQLLFFQGEAFEYLDRLDDAAASYEKLVTEQADSDFKFDALFALANVFEQLGQYDKALEHYQSFIKTGSDQPAIDEVRFRTAETMSQMALAAKELGNQEEYESVLKNARTLYGEVATVEGFDLALDAKYMQGICSHRLNELDIAATQFAVVADSDSGFAEHAGTLAGRDFFKIGDETNATKYLSKVYNGRGPYASEAAHWLCQIFLTTDRPAQAFDMANKAIGDAPADSGFLPELMQDKADAAYLIDDQRNNSPALYQAIVEKYPDHRLAPSAQYNAAFAYLETGKLDEALAASKEFEAKYAESDYLPDLLEVKADAHLLKKETAESQAVFQQLVNDNPDHAKINVWKVRVGLTQHMLKQYDEAIKSLSPMVETIQQPALKAEALYWIGASQLALKDFNKAETSLASSLEIDSTWRFASDTMNALSQAQIELGKTDEAQKTIAKMKTAKPDAPQVVEADYRLAETAYRQGKYKEAIQGYKQIIDNHAKSDFVPYSIAGIGWASLQDKDYQSAEKSFSQLISEYADSELAGQALLGRGMSRRQTGDDQGAIDDLKEFVDKHPEDQQVVEAKYELGLAQSAKAPKDAIGTFEDLVASAKEHKFADRFHYELAWLYKGQKRDAKALEEFVAITESFPDSSLAPEAHFQVGEAAYQAQEFADAVDSFLQCRNSGGEESLREKAAYRLGWCHYREKKFDASREAFAQQVNDFDSGKYKAEALVMIGESLYNQEKLEEAFAAYQLAKPAIEAAGNVADRNQWLTFLHGAVAANKTERFKEAEEFVSPLLESKANDDFKMEGWYELGVSLRGQAKREEAIEAFQMAGDNTGKIGAQARCMVGDLMFENAGALWSVDQKDAANEKFEEAITQYKNVFYGYGGTAKNAEVDPWQAYAIYHAARCNFIRIGESPADQKQKLINDAELLYQNLLKNYSDDVLAKDAQKDLDKLQQLKK